MKKTFSSFLIAFTVITFNISSVRADNVIMPDGDIIDGKINYILGSTVEIKTKNGFKKINRNLNKNSARDIIEVGFFKKKRITGEIIYLDDSKVMLKQNQKRLTLPRIKVKKIIIAHEELMKN